MNEIDGYDDIHDNVRYWVERLVVQATPTDGAIVLYDIGANDGEVTIPAVLSLRAGTNRGNPVRIVAFEPLPAARARLITRARECGLSFAMWGEADITIVPLALGNEDRMIELTVYSDDTFSSLYERPDEEMERYHLEAAEVVTARMRPLDDLVRGGTVPPPDVVKIDVEGAERGVLTGAVETLTRYTPMVVMEFSCINTANAGYDRRELVELLRTYGYDRFYGLYRNTDRTLRGEDSFDDCRIWNIIAGVSSKHPDLTV
ncbi:MAG: FkbM family methyltransferase [Alkalispirochaeta sp.]